MIQFDFYPSPVSIGADNNECNSYHPRVVGGRTVDMKQAVKHITQRSTLTEGDVYAAVAELQQEVINQLCEGNRMYIKGLGYFSLSLAGPKDCTPAKTHNQHIEVKQVNFRADQELKDALKAHASFERIRAKRHSETLDEVQMLQLLDGYFKDHSFITRPNFECLCNCTRTTAKRYLNCLVKSGHLVNTNTLRHPIYVLAADKEAACRTSVYRE